MPNGHVSIPNTVSRPMTQGGLEVSCELTLNFDHLRGPSVCLTMQNLSLFRQTLPTRPPSSSGASLQVSSSEKYVLGVPSTFPEMARSFSWQHHIITKYVFNQATIGPNGVSALTVPRSAPSLVASTPRDSQENSFPYCCKEYEKKSCWIFGWTHVEQCVLRNHTL